MASEVDICNLALSYLGDEATVASIDPPEGSAQAEHCARFYAIARDAVLGMHNWNFATRRVNLALVTNNHEQWEYAYALPSDCMTAFAVLDSDAQDDYSVRWEPQNWYSDRVNAGEYTTQPFSIELDSSGNRILYTNQENALLRYQAFVSDPAKFSSLFVLVLTWHLASMLAGPLIKGSEGRAEGQRCMQMMTGYLGEAKREDANQRRTEVEHIVPWISKR